MTGGLNQQLALSANGYGQKLGIALYNGFQDRLNRYEITTLNR